MPTICERCGREPGIAAGCAAGVYLDGSGARFEAVPFTSAAPICGDCGANRGELHHPFCCEERCPKCGDHLVSCGCGLAWRRG